MILIKTKKISIGRSLPSIHCFPIEHCDTIDFLFVCLEDFPEENTDCQYDANFLDHSSVNMNEILCLDVGGDKYRDGCWRVARTDAYTG